LGGFVKACVDTEGDAKVALDKYLGHGWSLGSTVETNLMD